MAFRLSDLIEVDAFQALLEDFTEITGAVTAILDIDGTVLVATGWQDICTKFHRANPGTACRCLESDTFLAGQLDAGEKYTIYRCRNGLVDVASPIVIDGKHVGNVFTGQFFLAPPDTDYFRDQAGEFGFDKTSYLSALARVPVFPEESAKQTISFLVRIAETIGKMGTTQLRLQSELSQRQKTEAALRKKNRELSKATEQAVLANRIKSQFLASMSHELRTPMNAILGFSQLMESNPNDPPSDTQKEYLGLVLNSGNQLLELIDQLLDLSKIEAGHLKVQPREVEVGPLIEECLVSLSPRADAIAVTLDNRIEEPLPPMIETDPALLRQVLLNLLSNAVKYNQPGGMVMVSARVTEETALRIRVRDNGPGIPPEKQADLFTPFNRLGREAGHIEGTGIGLSITKRIMEALGGGIGFRCEAGRGCDFWIDLPLTGPAPGD